MPRRRSLSRLLVLALCSFALVAGLLPAGVAFAAPVTYTVTGNGDSFEGNCAAAPGTINCTTFRAALDAANGNGNGSSDVDTINFAIPGGEIEEIAAVAGFNVSEPVAINGSSQTGDFTAPGIVINGATEPASTIGLWLVAGSSGSTVQGLVINGFSGAGLWVYSDDNTVVTNFIGTDASGTVAVQNGVTDSTFGTVDVRGANNTLDSNLIAGNGGIGIVVAGTDAHDNVIVANNIGVGYDGAALGNGRDGIHVSFAGADNTIDGNVIGANDDAGIFLQATNDTKIVQNTIGTNADRDDPLGNGGAGIELVSGSDELGGDNVNGTVIDDNLVVANGSDFDGSGPGIWLHNSGGSRVLNTTITGNHIGSVPVVENPDVPMGNAGPGIVIGRGAGHNSANVIGAEQAGDPGDRNVIAFNGGSGIEIAEDPQPNIANEIRENEIHDNDGLGIDLGADGTDENDALDADDGANHRTNTPVLDSFFDVEGSLGINWALDAAPDTTYRLTFYATSVCSVDDPGEGDLVAGYASGGDVTTNGSGQTSGDAFVAFDEGSTAGYTATARVISTVTEGVNVGDTSEFSECLEVEDTAEVRTISSDGPLENIWIGTGNGPEGAVDAFRCQVDHNGVSPMGYEFWSQISTMADCGTFVHIASEGLTYGPTIDTFTPDSPFTDPEIGFVTGDGSNGDPYTLEATADVTSGVSLIETTEYETGNEYYTTTITLENGNAEPVDFTLYHGFDCNFDAGEDTSGFGHHAADGTVSCVSEVAGAAESLTPMTGGSNYFEGGFNELWGNDEESFLNGDPLPDTVSDTLTDDAAALSWTDAIPADGSVTFELRTTITSELPGSDVATDLGLDVDPQTTDAGWAELPQSFLSLVGAGLEAGQIEASAGPTAAPLGRNPLGRNPLGRNPLGRNPLGRNPLGRNPLGRNPLGRNPVGLSTTQPPLRGVLVSDLVRNALPDAPLLTDLPTTHIGGWAALVGNAPEQSANLNTALQAGALANVTIPEIDWSATRFADLSPAAWLLGKTRMSEITLPSGTWADLRSQMGTGCSSFTDASTLLDLQWNRCDLTVIPWRQIPLSNISTLASSPLGQYRLDGVVLALTTLADTPATVLGSLNGCPACTLAEAQDTDPAGAIDPAAAVKDLGTALQTTTLEDLLPGLIDVSAFPYESMSVTQLIKAAVLAPDVVDTQPHVTYTTSFLAPCDFVPLDVTLHLPNERFRVVPDTSVWTVDGTPEAADEPTYDEGTSDATWSLDEVTLPVGCESGISIELATEVIPGPDTGDFDASSTVSPQAIDGDDVSASLDEPLHVEDGAESGNDTASATAVDPNVLYTGTVGSTGDVDYFTMDVPARSDTVAVYLSHVPASEDLDLVLYGEDSEPALRTADVTRHPLGRNPVDDGGGCLPTDYVTMPQTLEDVPVLGSGFEVRSYSTNRSSLQEVVCTVGRETDSGEITIQVSGFNDSHGDHPYVLRVLALGAPSSPSCVIPAMANTGTAVATPATIPASTRTLFLINADRFGDQYGATAEANTLASLQTLAARPEVNGAILPVENNTGVASAYATLNASACSTSAANGVVRAINAYVDSVVSARNLRQLRFVVLVGADNQIPFARIADLTQLGNQSEYQADLRFNGNDNPASRAASEGYYLSDDPYGAFHPIPWSGNRLYLPDVSVGRLVETPAQIQNQIAQYVSSNGVLDPSTALVTGYDFTSDAADAIANALAGEGSATTRLIDFPDQTDAADNWNRAALLNALNAGPRVIGINGHFDHFRTLTAGNDIASTTDFAGTSVPFGSLLFSLGCNAGASVANVWITGTNPATTDWAEALAAKRSTGVLNTGFGYGDDTTIAYSEELMRLFVRNLDGSMSVGQAFAFAKAEYYGNLTAISSYDLKSMQESVFYGLPMQRYGTSGVIAAPSGASSVTTFAANPGTFSVTSTTTDPDTGLDSVEVPISPFMDATADIRHTPDGDYFVGPAVQETQYRPLEPTSGAFDMTFEGHKLHDAIVTHLEVQDLPNFDPVMERPLIDLSGPEPVVPNVAFPNDYVTTASAQTVLGPRDYLVVSGGRFVSDPVDPTVGTQRIYTDETVRAYYSDSNDFTRPEIDSVTAVATGSTAFRVVVAPGGDVAAVYAMYLPTGSDTFVLKALSSADGLTWTGHVADDATEWFVQAVDGNGNVALSTFKGISYPVISADDGGVDVTITGTGNGGAPLDGWYVDGATVILENGDESFAVTVDGVPTDDSPIPVNGEGAHLVEFTGDQGSSGSVIVPVDSEKPDVELSLGEPSSGTFVAPTTVVNAVVSDGASGVASCAISGTGVASTTPATCTAGANEIDLTGGDGAKAIHVEAADEVGHTRTSDFTLTLDGTAPTFGACPTGIAVSYLNGEGATATITASDTGAGIDAAASTLTATVDTSSVPGTVRFTAVDEVGNTATKTCDAPVYYRFTGFMQPVDNANVNSAKAGQSIPVKWRITDANGVPVTDPASFVSVTSTITSAACGSSPDAIETYAGGGGLQNLGNGYWQFNWKTPLSYKGQCRTMRVNLADGDPSHTARFVFK